MRTAVIFTQAVFVVAVMSKALMAALISWMSTYQWKTAKFDIPDTIFVLNIVERWTWEWLFWGTLMLLPLCGLWALAAALVLRDRIERTN